MFMKVKRNKEEEWEGKKRDEENGCCEKEDKAGSRG